MCARAPADDGRSIHIAYIGESGTAGWNGARLGLDEANLQGRFLGQRFVMVRSAAAVPENLDTRQYLAVLADLPADELRALADRYDAIPILNLTSKNDRLRQACLPNVFHIIQSNAMELDAVAQWHARHPGDRVRAAGWHPDFVKYAGRDLNKRFTKAYGRPMDERAWAGWAAARMVADAVVRGVPAEAAALREHLRTRLAFDGQKGLNMTFRPTGQLRQPLLLIDATGIVGEAPVRGVFKASDYDSLGIGGCAR